MSFNPTSIHFHIPSRYASSYQPQTNSSVSLWDVEVPSTPYIMRSARIQHSILLRGRSDFHFKVSVGSLWSLNSSRDRRLIAHIFSSHTHTQIYFFFFFDTFYHFEITTAPHFWLILSTVIKNHCGYDIQVHIKNWLWASQIRRLANTMDPIRFDDKNWIACIYFTFLIFLWSFEKVFFFYIIHFRINTLKINRSNTYI